jgi:glycosyltransferase involved in cell wall biosynthesis
MSTYNDETTIEKAIHSIRNQTYQDFKLVIIDDCSDDGTYQVCKKLTDRLKDDRIHLFKNNRNMGTYANRNAALKMFIDDVEYWTINDGDDISLPLRFEICIQEMQDIKLFGCMHSHLKYDENNQPTTVFPESEGTVIYKKECFKYLGYYDNNRFGADTEYLYRAYHTFGRDKILWIKEDLYHAYTPGKNLTIKYPDQVRQMYINKFKNDINTLKQFGNVSRKINCKFHVKKNTIYWHNDIYVYMPYYIESKKERMKEINHAIKLNSENQEIDKIYLFTESDVNKIVFEKGTLEKKIKIVSTKDVPTFNDILKKSNSVNPDGVNIIINSDIYIDEDNVQLIRNQIIDRMVFALSRYDFNPESKKFELRNLPYSQDSWVYKGRVFPFDEDIPFGIPGCDNRIAYEFREQGYIVSNPSKTIETYHYHISGVRKYNKNTDLLEGKYCFLFPVTT